ncbi:uncharacterized protein LOC108249317 [Kryptolebias marmoratus]|uniref:uncharacterized protein LOC108238138 n=1 Tax=Kryptolebias marmoratus TaxID=37003 RepID=UPI0007F877F1|nr:uncharacterized protein LOC108238138 [Kryptolebias marmoratus]XP_024862558.1 uncharacterized protein LOC108238137 [Kryptolebias marmoratus]XP_024863721.1 uncharacterized protein LOC112450831 [Kryptolebias marmoratus]XP_024863722.1 uncharacterized protein LOC112450832 [Kryptolebias marmoratus]XP_037831749.1 uncharacterized protein LOC119617050 [Kryptolebias marmoratus]XP_037831750.1 uncharacterized protein LOC108249317 [Kryptolebias marmoratus]
MSKKTSSLKTQSEASYVSSTGSAAAKARARAEAVKARLSFAAKEMNLKVEKAKIEASIEFLQQEKDVASAIAEAEALEAAVVSQMEARSNPGPSVIAERTEQYVTSQTKFVEGLESAALQPSQVGNVLQDRPELTSNESLHSKQEDDPQQTPVCPPNYLDNSQNPPVIISSPHTNKDFTADWSNQVAASSFYEARPSRQESRDSNVNDFIRYFARREIVSTGLLQFNDKPQNFRAWKRSFENTIRGLDLTASEEMDLMLKWLGKESAEQVEQIRAIHINNPVNGLNMMWNRLEQCYGSAEAIEDALFKRIEAFPKITPKDYSKLRKFSDLLMEIQSAKDDGDLPGLAFLDTARGVNPIVQKLPFHLQEKWITVGTNYKRTKCVFFPPFNIFVDFVTQEADSKNDPSFNFTSFPDFSKPDKLPWRTNRQKEVSVHKTDVVSHPSSDIHRSVNKAVDIGKICPIHKKPHPLSKCRTFRMKTLDDRKMFLKENNLCFKCCASSSHIARDCKVKVQCSECHDEKHCSALHPGPAPWQREIEPAVDHGGEPDSKEPEEITSSCTQVCGTNEASRSCSKICLVQVYPAGCPQQAVKLYAIHDEQSNRSLVRPEFFELFNDCGPSSPYSIRTCAGTKDTMGRRAIGYVVAALDGSVHIPLPSLIECKNIPNDRDEIPTPSAAMHHSHLKSVANLIPELDSNAPILMLLGRDVIRVHKVRKQISGPNNAPYAQKLDLGWVVVGNVCVGDIHKTLAIKTLFTNATEKGRPTMFEPCPNVFNIKEKHCEIQVPFNLGTQLVDSTCEPDHLGCNVFKQTRHDNYIAPSIQDNVFLKIMEEGITKDKDNNWTAPLPFKLPRQKLPNNRPQALKRLMSLVHNFEQKEEMKEHFVAFMDKVFKNNHAEIAPPLKNGEECWYLPLFGIYHPRKPKQIRVVFDSSAKYEGVSLNDVLLTGPDLNNSLLGVLIRFRKEAVAFTADIEQMFYCFNVHEQDRNYLRFLWFRDNDISKDIVEYRMRVHVFGNSPSPAVAIYGLHQSVLRSEPDSDPDVRQFVTRDFYVDDGLKSLPTIEMAVSLLQRTRDTLAKSNLRLHKIAANRKEVLEAFPTQDHAKDLKDLDFEADSVIMQRSLGLLWDLGRDCFTFRVPDETKPFTKRGVLSTINSLYDPLGFVAPVTIQGKSILRELTVGNGDWDTPLPPEKEESWTLWKDSLKELSDLTIARAYTDISPSTATKRELCVFSDASTKAIAAVAYLRVTDAEGNCQVGFIMGKAKLAPRPDQTIPRLELSAAVLAVELADLIADELDLKLDCTIFHTDSKVVLGYIYNETRRFYVYVSNRVTRIRRSSQPSQWHYVASSQNPADHATRSVPAYQLPLSNWLTGPDFLLQVQKFPHESHDLVDPSKDSDVRPCVTVLKTAASTKHLGSDRFSKFSTWRSLTRALSRLLHLIHNFKSPSNRNNRCSGWHYCETGLTVDEFKQAQNIVIQAVQQDVYSEEIQCIQNNESLPKTSPLKNLDPYLDENGLLRVGGRITDSNFTQGEKNPLLVPGHHHVAVLLIKHYHNQVHHQGRLFTEGTIRSAGWWIIGGKRKVSTVIYHCVTCKRLRAPLSTQKMSDLPPDRLSTDPPFTNVGLDVFGPWYVSSRRTRGSVNQIKRLQLVTSRRQMFTDISGVRSSTCQTPSGTNGRKSSFLFFSHVASGKPANLM